MVYYVNMYLSMKRFTFILLLTFTQIIVKTTYSNGKTQVRKEIK